MRHLGGFAVFVMLMMGASAALANAPGGYAPLKRFVVGPKITKQDDKAVKKSAKKSAKKWFVSQAAMDPAGINARARKANADKKAKAKKQQALKNRAAFMNFSTY